MDIAGDAAPVDGESPLHEDLGHPGGLGNVGSSPSHSGSPIIAGLPQRKKWVCSGEISLPTTSLSIPDVTMSWMYTLAPSFSGSRVVIGMYR